MPTSPLPRHEPSVSFSQEDMDTVSLAALDFLVEPDEKKIFLIRRHIISIDPVSAVP